MLGLPVLDKGFSNRCSVELPLTVQKCHNDLVIAAITITRQGD